MLTEARLDKDETVRFAPLYPPCDTDGLVWSDSGQDVDLDALWSMLRGTYWARDRDRATTQRNVENAAVLLAAHRGRELVATARVVAVQRKVNWLFDVVVADAERGRGLGSRVLQRILDHPALAEATRLFLDTRDAMPFYQRFGFRELERDNHANSSLMVAHLRLRRP